MCVGARIRWDRWSSEGSRAERPSLWSKEVTVPTDWKRESLEEDCVWEMTDLTLTWARALQQPHADGRGQQAD